MIFVNKVFLSFRENIDLAMAHVFPNKTRPAFIFPIDHSFRSEFSSILHRVLLNLFKKHLKVCSNV